MARRRALTVASSRQRERAIPHPKWDGCHWRSSIRCSRHHSICVPPHTPSRHQLAKLACWFPVAEEPRMKQFLGAPLLASSILIYCIGRRGGEETTCSLTCPSLALFGSSTTALKNSQGSIKMHSRHPGGSLKIPVLPTQRSSPTFLALPQSLESRNCCPP